MNGYTQLNIGGSVRGFKWGNYAMQLYFIKSKVKSIEELSQLMDAVSAPLLLYCGLDMNCFRKGEDPDFTFENVFDWVEDMPLEEKTSFFQKLNEVIQESQIMKDAADINKKKESDIPLSNGKNQKKKKGSLLLES